MNSEDPGDSGGVRGSGVNCNNLVPVPAETGVLGEGDARVWGTEEGKARSREGLLPERNLGFLYAP